MLNYSKARKSVDRTGSKKTLSKGLSGNKSHTSSINIKLSQDLSYAENIKLVPKTHLREKCDPFSQIERVRNTNLSKYSNSNQKQKYSIKLQANEIKDGRDSYVCKDVRDTYNMGKEGGYLCKGSYVGKECVYGCKESINGNAKKDIYDATMMATHTKPLQESNRFMETERYSKEVKNERSLSRNAGSKLRTEYMQSSSQKYKRQVSTRQTNTSSNQFVKINVADLRAAIHEFAQSSKEVESIERQLKFYRKQCQREMNNSVISALRA